MTASTDHNQLGDALQQPTLSDNALKVLSNRYLAKDQLTGEVAETPKELFMRVAAAVAAPEKEVSEEQFLHWSGRYYQLMATGTFMPNSPTLMNAGRRMGMLSACFVLPVEDSISDIFDTLKNVALIQKAGGGTGFSFSRLRPEGDIVASSGGTTSGPMAFIDAFSAGTEAIQQGAFRRGANMGVMRCDHPDVIEFLRAKSDLSRWTNYNVSVAVTNEWMQKVVDSPDEAVLTINPRDQRKAWMKKSNGRRISEADYEAYAAGELNPQESYWTYSEVMQEIVQYAWRNGEPGMLFLDRANEDNQVPHLGEYEATNPCGEQWLLPYGSCNLGSLNLASFYKADGVQSGNWEDSFDWEEFDSATDDSVRFLDDVISINNYPIDEIRERAEETRRIGLGVMGFADLLFKLNVRYGSEQSFSVARSLSARLQERATLASEKLCSEGQRSPFTAWEGSKPQVEAKPERRNSHLTTVAPTGTISIISDCSGGIEPLFSLAFQRQVMKDVDGKPVVMREVDDAFQEALAKANYTGDEIDAIIEHAMERGSIADCEIDDAIKEVFVTAHDVTPREHVLMQAAWQSSIDNAVSKTINLPHDADESVVRDAYLLAWREGCKGVTVYRDGCRDMQPMALKEQQQEQEVAANTPAQLHTVAPVPLPEMMPSMRIRQITPFGNMHVKITVDAQHEREMEVFAQLGKGGDTTNSDLEAICRMMSLFMRSGGEISYVIRQLKGIGSSLAIPTRDGRVMSLADGLATALERYIAAKQAFGLRSLLLGEIDPEELDAVLSDKPRTARPGSGNAGIYKVKCPSCDGSLAFEEGCCKCHSCGYSQC
ncbi:MAG: adenosylcobalamin-dependent ribonucleoside-diphosphate reductase [Planctomycetota bacterium]|jgi:ribonucleoside-diphosphate reductase alpha chain|nr:adenosylcobalamin-dependent ribonucleoside-diphosphate reductase [Planctomycetota bacterium]